MTWSTLAQPIGSGSGIDLTPVQVLYQYNEPLLFRSRMGLADVLCYKLEEIENNDLYLVSLANEQAILALAKGQISIRGALENDTYWIVEANGFVSIRAWNVPASEIPDDFLPESRVGLFSRFGEVPDSVEQAEAFLSFKFTGPELTRERILFKKFKSLIDTVHDTVHKLITPPSLYGMRTGDLFDFFIGEPKLASVLITVQEPVVNFEAISRRRKLPNGFLASDIREGMEQERDAFIEKVAEMNDMSSSSNVGYRRFVEENYEIATALVDLAPFEGSAYDAVEFNATISNGEKRSILVDRSMGVGLRQAYSDASYFTKTVVGRVFIVNTHRRTFVISGNHGRDVTCALSWGEFAALERSTDNLMGKTVQVTGKYFPRTNRDYIDVTKASLN